MLKKDIEAIREDLLQERENLENKFQITEELLRIEKILSRAEDLDNHLESIKINNLDLDTEEYLWVSDLFLEALEVHQNRLVKDLTKEPIRFS